jgi:hypothetical protein
LRARFDASRARGDIVHRREESRFQLQLNGDPKAALRLAQENWKVQREPRICASSRGCARNGRYVRTRNGSRLARRDALEYPAVAALVKSDEGRGK